MKKYKLVIMSLLLSVLSAEGQDVFLNKGAIRINNTGETTLYIKGNIKVIENSAIHQEGKTVLTGDFINNVSNGNVFAGSYNTGLFEFRGGKAQVIKGNANKAANYIVFPKTLLVNNLSSNTQNATVTLDAEMGATITDMALSRGRFVLDSKPVTTVVNSMHAHLMVNGSIDYKSNASAIQVNLSLGDNYKTKRLAGFTPPFRSIYSDYFFYNFLSRPTNKGLFGNTDRLIIDPRTPLKGGLGYIVGMDIIPTSDPYYTTHWDPRWKDAKKADKATDIFSFAREFIPQSFGQYITDANAPDRITGEQLITQNVTVNLEKGFNYLGNPFTVPLDMTSFVESNGPDEWGVSRGAGGAGQVRNGFYVMASGIGSYNGSQFTFNASYLLAQAIGGTMNKDGGKYLLAPMQMFIVGSNTANTIPFTIPASKRTHGSVSYLRSTATDEPIDELLIETTDQETKGYDRLCVVFRDDANLTANDTYDTPKLFNRSGGVNQIYTKSSDNKTLTTNIIPSETKRLTMYFEPSHTVQEVVLTAGRLESLQSITQVILEDTKTGIKTDLTDIPSYTFMSYPTDQSDRFTLHFSSTPMSINDVVSSVAPNAYYQNGVIYIQKLQNDDLGKEISVYNMQGQILHKERVREITPCKITKVLDTGIYVIRIDNNHTTKLFVK